MVHMVYPNLLAEMARSGYTVGDLAEVLGIHITGVYLMLKGERNISIKRAKNIRDRLFPGQKIDYLFDGVEVGSSRAKRPLVRDANQNSAN